MQDHPITAIIVTISNLTLFFSCVCTGWLLREADRVLRRLAGVSFFWLCAVLVADLTYNILFQDNLVFGAWHLVLLRALIAVAGSLLAFTIYTDLSQPKSDH